MRATICILVAAATGSLLPAGCDISGPIEIHNPGSTGSGGTNNLDGGSPDAAGGMDAGTGGEDAGVSPVLVAIAPTPLSKDGAPQAGDVLDAELTTFGAGVRAAVVVLPWDAMSAGSNAALAQKTAFYAKHDKRVVLNLAVVDRLADHRPSELVGTPWNGAGTVASVRAAIDALFAASGDEVRFLTFGRDVDVYLAAHPGERSPFVAFAKEACAYAKKHAEAPKDFRVGVAFTTSAPKNEPAFADLLDIGDVVGFSYFPGLGTMETDPSSNATAVLGQLADIGASKPVVLQAAGIASDPAAGGSEDVQKKFLATLFGGISAHRKSFALASVVELHDAPHATCAAWAMSQGEPDGSPFAAYACSLGLFRSDGTPKLAWSAVVAGAAALSAP